MQFNGEKRCCHDPREKDETLVSALHNNVKNCPDQTFVRWVNNKCAVVDSLSYRQLWYKSGLVADLLLANGVQRGDRLMIAYDFGLDFLPGLFGCMRLGVIACSVYPPNFLDKAKAKYSFAQFDRQVQDAGAKIALTSTKFKRGLTGASLVGLNTKNIKWLSTNNMKSPKGGGRRTNDDLGASSLKEVRPETTAFIQYSSGSTGEPKGVVITHAALVYNLYTAIICTRIPEGSVCVTWMPQYHDYALVAGFLMSCYNSDTSLVGASPLDFISRPLLWADMLDKFGATHTGGPNFAYALLAKRMKAVGRTLNRSKTTLKHVNVAAEPIAAKTLEQMREIGIQQRAFVPCYGMAETCASATYCPGNEVRVVDGVVSSALLSISESVGKVARVALTDGSIADDGQEGEIYLRGPDVARCYWNKPELDSRFKCRLSDGEDYFATGDVGKVVDGRLYVVGRLKELIIINGRNVYPTDIERVIENEFPDIVRPGSTVAFQRTDADVGLVIEIRKTVKRDVSDIFSMDKVRALVSDAMNVDAGSIVFLNQGTVPKTTSGKLKRVEARRLSLEGLWEKGDIKSEWSKSQQRSLYKASLQPSSALQIANTGDDLSNQVLRLIMNETYCKLQLEDTLESLGLTSIGVASLHAALLERFDLAEEAFPIEILFNGQMKVADLVTSIKDITVSEGGKVTTTLAYKELTPFILPSLVNVVGYVQQVVGLLVPPIYLAVSIAPLGVIALPRSLGFAILMAPVAALLYTVSSALFLVLIKWTVLGKLQAGNIAVWGTKFAQRWIVRACCRACFRYTPWRYLNKTEPLSILQRWLGCRVGRGSYIDNEYIDDFDLVTVGSGTTVEGYMDTARVSLGVLTLAPIKVGSKCRLQDICTIEMGSVIEDGVRVHPRSLVVQNSLLPKDSQWHGKPAVRMEDSVVFEGVGRTTESGTVPDRTREDSAPGSLGLYRLTQYLTLYVMTPYLSALFSALVFVTGRELFRRCGLIGFCVLIWVPVTVPAVLVTLLSVIAKKLLLGRVRPGKWRQHGSFHRRRFVVDHLVDFHVMRWKEIASLFGSPLAHSPYLTRLTWTGLGGGIGQNTIISRHMKYTGYDLVNVGNNNLWGGGGRCLPWSVKDGWLVAQSVTSGDNVFVGGRSTVMGGVRLEDNATVAAYSVASKDVSGEETVIGVDIKKTKLESTDSRVDDTWALVLGCHLNGLLLWFVAGLVTAAVGFPANNQTSMAINFLSYWVLLCVGFGSTLAIILPLYAASLSICSKYLFVGVHLSGEISRNSWPAVLFWADHVMEPIKDSFFRQPFGGTFLETFFYQLLGARLGTNVYLDSVSMYEPDLVRIGDHACVGTHSTLCPHQVNRTNVLRACIRIGARATVGRSTMLHGNDVIEDDSTLGSSSMSLSGTTMKGGVWKGYPARRAGPSFQPKRPSLPKWYILLFNPVSAYLGLFWMAILSIGGFFCRPQMQKLKIDADTQSMNLPDHMNGVYESCELPVRLRFDCGRWVQHLRLLQLDGGTFVESTSRDWFYGCAWCWWVGYSLTFDIKLTQAEGKVSFGGWWHVPESIVCLRLRYDEGGWIAGHSWFCGDPVEEIYFQRCVDDNI